MPLFVSVKVSNIEEATKLHRSLRGGVRNISILPFKQAPRDARPDTIAFIGLGGDNTGGRLPYKRGWIAIGKISNAKRVAGSTKGEMESMDVDVVHVRKEPIDGSTIEKFTQFKQEFQFLPHWGLKHAANQTVQPFRDDATARSLLSVYCSTESQGIKQLLIRKLPELKDFLEATAVPRVDLPATGKSFANGLVAAHLSYGEKPRHKKFATSLLAALATKPFAIFTGQPGSGKTQLALRFGDWLSYGGRDARFSRVLALSVRPDWTGSEYLFGYQDVLQPAKDGRPGWSVPRALEFMLRATNDAENPHLLILDEMNLAHVERYFADLLSGLESREPILPNLLKEEDGVWREDPEGPSLLRIPTNLFVIGTINIDETTHTVSPKVLDRANVFEFRVQTNELTTQLRSPEPCPAGEPELVRGYLQVAADNEYHQKNLPGWIHDYQRDLLSVHQVLYSAGMEFTKRIFYESVRFAVFYALFGEGDLDSTLDCQLLQRILPRLHGARRRIEPVLCALGRFAALKVTDAADLARTAVGSSTRFDPETFNANTAKLPLSFDKILRMTKSVRENQYVSFTE